MSARGLRAAAAVTATAVAAGLLGPLLGAVPAHAADAVHDLDLPGSVHPLDLERSIEDLRSEEVRGDTTTVTIAADVLFAFDEAGLGSSAERALADVADRLSGVRGTVRIVGHTDGKGTASYNQDLSERRAATVQRALEDELGPDAPDITASGRGSTAKVAEERDPEGHDDPDARARNRRVEISFTGG